MQQLGAAAHHAAPLLIHTGQVAGHVDDIHQRNPECVAQSHETRCLLGTFGVQAAAQPQWVVGQHSDGPAGQPAKADNDRRRPLGLKLVEQCVVVEQCLHERVHVVGPPRRLGQQRMQVDLTGFGLVAVEMTLLAEQSDKATPSLVGVDLVVGDDVADPRLLVVRLGTTQRRHVDVLAGHAADHVGPGDEHAAIRRHHDDVGECGAVRGTTGREADHHRYLRDVARRADHGLEHQSDCVQGLYPLRQPRPARMPDAHDRALLLDREVVGVHDVPAALDPHRAAHDSAIGAERNGANAVDGAGRSKHAGPVALVQKPEAPVIEEGGQPQQRVPWVERFADRLGDCDRHRCLLAGVGVVSTCRRRVRRCARRIRMSC